MDNRRKFSAPAQIMRISTRVDGGLGMSIVTGELTRDEISIILDFKLKPGWFIFAENRIQEEELPKQDSEFETKTPSQRLRGALFVLWDQQGKKDEFENYYRSYMEKIIEHIKSKLI